MHTAEYQAHGLRRAQCSAPTLRACFCSGWQLERDACTGHVTDGARMVTGMTDRIHRILSLLDVNPVLVDVGASAEPPQIWDAIADTSVYIGFDPDSRDLHDTTGGHFRRSIVVNKALSADETRDHVDLF